MTRARTLGLASIAIALAASAIGCSSCKKVFWGGPGGEASSSSTAPPPSVTGALDPNATTSAKHPRLLLTSERLAAIGALHTTKAKAWTRLQDECDDYVKESHPSGYMGWDWANGTLDLTLCFRVTKRQAYADAAIKYFVALLDDDEKLGDHKGGERVVRHDDGYPMRSRGALGAIAYDWLDGVPGMTPELKTRAMDRFVAWTTWFGQKGFNHDEPISNYYVGYFAAGALAALAAAGEDPRADALRKKSVEMWNKEIVPAYRAKLAGGDFPEGWQYGDNVLAFLALFCDAERTAHAETTASRIESQLPWLEETVAYHAHALWPDGKHVYDTGDWQEHPPRAPSHGLASVALMLPRDASAAKEAAFLAKLAEKALGEDAEEWKWFGVLTDDSKRASDDPRKGPPSYLAKGTATALARTDWSANAVWVAMSSAPSISDHQHLDAGHFEIVRGSDALVIDSGDYSAYSSMSHNTILVDDKKEVMAYTPNQGTWSKTAKMARFADDGRVVYAMADYASAYDGPSKKHAAPRAERELVFARGAGSGGDAGASNASARAVVVVYDRITVAKPTYVTTWLLHGGKTPELAGASATIKVGQSAAWMTTLLPPSAAPRLVNEPTPMAKDRPFFNNEPPDGVKSVRIEVPSTGDALDVERRFLNAFVIGGASDPAPAKATLARGEGVDAAVVGDEAFVFVSSGPQASPAAISLKLPASIARVFVVGLAIDAKYDVTATPAAPSCAIALTSGNARVASSAGTLAIGVAGCALAK